MIADEASARGYVAERCDAAAMTRLDTFAENLVAENRSQNLVAAATEPVVWQRHIADSAQLLDHAPEQVEVWLDLGTGAGFPGLVVAAMRPNIPVVLVESRARRVEWLQHCCQALGLGNCTVAGTRIETIGSFPAGVISARAFAPLPRLLGLARRFSTTDTVWLLPKGRSASQELHDMPIRIQRMFHVEQSVTDREAGIIVGTGLEAE